MKLVIIHFHLNRGGVTSVILNHLQSLEIVGSEAIEEVILIHGGRSDGLADRVPARPLRVLEIPELEYDSERNSVATGLSARLQSRLLEAGCSPDGTICHAHNHSLGKNVAFLETVRYLAEQGWRWLLQIHDFAEDFRAENYRHLLEKVGEGDAELLSRRLYPQADQIHYAVLNGRDHAILSGAGIPPERLHTIPNPVFPFNHLPEIQTARKKLHQARGIERDRRLLVYPVRGIRRKNLGEMLLWSALGQGRFSCANTLPPQNPIEKTSYDEWKSFAEELGLPCEWELGTVPDLSFAEILSAADAVLTTSLAEGFGMVFLETWLAGKPLFGRDLPEITQDFKQVGIWYPQLSSHMLIPRDCLDLTAVRGSFLESYRSVLKQFGVPVPGEAKLNQQFESLLTGDALDFAILDRRLQSDVIRKAWEDPALADRIVSLNPPCKEFLSNHLQQQQEIIRTNSDTILSEYSRSSIGGRLSAVYRALLQARSSSIRALRAPQSVRDAFLTMSRFHPLRVSP